MKRRNKKYKIIILITLLLTSCTNTDDSEQTQNVTQEKKELIYSTYDITPEMKTYISEYNRKQDGVFIKIEDYSEKYNNTKDGIQAMKIDLSGKHAPDLIDMSLINLTQVAQSGYLENLLPYFESDYKKEEFQWNAMSAGIYDDEMYVICPYYSIITSATKKSNSPETKDKMASASLKEMIYHRPNDCKVFLYQSKHDILYDFLYHDMDEFIDWKTGTCHFDSSSFQDILEISSQFPDEITEYVYDENCAEELSEIQNGNVLMSREQIRSVEDYMKMTLKYEDNLKVIGFPVNGVCQNIVEWAGSPIAISSQSNFKEEAWLFLKEMLEETYQLEHYKKNQGLPVSKKVMEKIYLDAMCENSYIDEDGKTQKIPKVSIGEPERKVSYCLSETQKHDMQTMIDSAVAKENKDDDIIEIIYEEACYYYSGDKNLEEVISIIQNRVSIYASVNEL